MVVVFPYDSVPLRFCRSSRPKCRELNAMPVQVNPLDRLQSGVMQKAFQMPFRPPHAGGNIAERCPYPHQDAKHILAPGIVTQPNLSRAPTARFIAFDKPRKSS